MSACWAPSTSSAPYVAPESSESVKPETVESAPVTRVIKLENGSYVELLPGLETGFAHCCGDDQHKMEVECSDGLVRCYRLTGKRWEQTYGKHCKAALDTECYEKTCAQVCEAYWEVGPAAWKQVIP